mgnify:CR=1 FL=1
MCIIIYASAARETCQIQSLNYWNSFYYFFSTTIRSKEGAIEGLFSVKWRETKLYVDLPWTRFYSHDETGFVTTVRINPQLDTKSVVKYMVLITDGICVYLSYNYAYLGAKKMKINWYCNLAHLWGACGTASVCSWTASPWSRSCTISKNSLRISVLGWKKTHKWTFWLQHPLLSTSSICCRLKVRSISNLAFSLSGYISFCFFPPTNKIVDTEITLVGGKKGHLGRNSVM